MGLLFKVGELVFGVYLGFGLCLVGFRGRGFRISVGGLGLRDQGRRQGLGFEEGAPCSRERVGSTGSVSSLGFRDYGAALRVWGRGLKVRGLGCWGQGAL